ncbi:MAG: hypothetical protein ABSF14_21245 [Terriglobia bacterium]
MTIKIEHSSDSNELENLLGRKKGNVAVFTGKPPSQYSFDEFLDKETLAKVIAFEKNNPAKIKMWQEEDRKMLDNYYKLKRFLSGNLRGRRCSEIQTKQADVDILNRCKLLFPTNSFVISVSQWYSKTHKISEKQVNVLKNILNSYIEDSSQSNRIQMPDPAIEGDSITVRILFYKNIDGKIDYFKKITGEKFKTPAIFLNIEEVGVPGVEKDMQVPKTLYQSIDKELTNRNLTFVDLPGRILTITADYWTDAPIKRRTKECPKCKGKGCKFCVVTGDGEDSGICTGLRPPTRYDAVFRDDLMNTIQCKEE